MLIFSYFYVGQNIYQLNDNDLRLEVFNLTQGFPARFEFSFLLSYIEMSTFRTDFRRIITLYINSF